MYENLYFTLCYIYLKLLLYLRSENWFIVYSKLVQFSQVWFGTLHYICVTDIINILFFLKMTNLFLIVNID